MLDALTRGTLQDEARRIGRDTAILCSRGDATRMVPVRKAHRRTKAELFPRRRP